MILRSSDDRGVAILTLGGREVGLGNCGVIVKAICLTNDKKVAPNVRRRILLAGAAATFGIVLAAGPAYASTTTNWPYSLGTPGYDVSYPQCSVASSYPTNFSGFAIIGVGDGRPFTANPCVKAEWGAALTAQASSISIYINTGNSGAYGHDITAACAANVPSIYSRKLAQAWEIGCSEADYAFATASLDGVTPATPTTSGSTDSTLGGGMWWADVENGNSWSTNTALNQATIEGVTDELSNPVNPSYTGFGGLPVGVYSNTTFWSKITGSSSWSPSTSNADWYAGSSCSSFDGKSVWVAQYGTTSTAGDPDTAC